MHPLYVSFLGIDSIGKTTAAKLLSKRLTAANVRTELVSWKSALNDQSDRFLAQSLKMLYVQTYSLMYLNSKFETIPNPAHDLLTSSAEEFFQEKIEDKIAALLPRGNKPIGLLGMALVELAGNIILFEKKIKRSRDQGNVVIQDSFGFKHVIKELIIMKSAAQEHDTEELFNQVVELTIEVFSKWLKPDIGIYLRASTDLAIKFGDGRPWGAVEDLKCIGKEGVSGFVELQSISNEYFSKFSERNRWHAVDVIGQPVEEIVDSIEIILKNNSGGAI